MNAGASATNSASRQRYLNPIPKLDSPLTHALWGLTNPWLSYTGGKALHDHVDDLTPDVWERDMAGRRVLIVGSGPSLDAVDDDFFAGFDTVIHINFAIRRAQAQNANYFFTTDLGPVGELLDTIGGETFVGLGQERCIYAPIFLDQWHMVKPAGRALFTFLRYDSAVWTTQTGSIGPIRLPYTLRYAPRQPDWSCFDLPRRGRALPILCHSSALTAILFAAMNGARDIGLIGCDFSTGRAKSAQSSQADPQGQIFFAAAQEFRKMAAALARSNVTVTNHSWTI